MVSRSIKEVHSWASSFLNEHNIQFSALEAELLICNLYSWDKSQFYLNLNQEMAAKEQEILTNYLVRRVTNEPLQYIIGSQDFYGREFQVNSSVLIPRPETELLVEALLNAVNSIWPPATILNVVDVGSGSGAIAITIALERNSWTVYGVDISNDALNVANANADRLGARINFYNGDLLQPLHERDIKVDIIVSNPPYIPKNDILSLMPEVKNFEPQLALDGGEDGLDFYREIINQSKQLLNRPGLIIFEVGINQANDISDLLIVAGAANVEFIKDYQGIDRIVKAIFK